MATNLMDDVGSMLGPETFAVFGKALGTTTGAISGAAKTGIATLLGGLVAAGSAPGGATRILDLLRTNHYDRPDSVTRLGALQADPSGAARLADEGRGVLGSLFGDKLDGMASALGSATGLTGATAGRWLAMLAPFVLGALGRRVADERMDAAGLTSFLGVQRSFVSEWLPDGVARLFGASTTYTGAAHPSPAYEHRVEDRARPEATRDNRWLWPVLALAALVPLSFLLFRGFDRGRVDERDEVRLEEVFVRGEPVAPALPPAPAVAPAPVALKGVSGFTSAITDAKVQLPAAFQFDDLEFATGSADLPSVQASLDGVARLMNQHPDARIRVDGHTDSTGTNAANEALGEARAQAVKQALVTRGVGADRIEARGMAAERPAATNETEAGRSENRRIEIVLTHR